MNVRTAESVEDKIGRMFLNEGNDDGSTDTSTSNDIGDGEGEGQSTDGNVKNTPAATPRKDNEQQAGQENGAGQPNANTGEGGKPQRGQEQQQPRRDTQPVKPGQHRLPANANGDLVDHTGRVIAKAGNERRFFESARQAQTQVRQFQSQLDTVQRELSVYKEAAVLPQQLGLQPTEVANAMHFMAHWKKNPVEAATKVLTDLRAMGYEVEGLGGGGVDTSAIKQMINEAISPFVNDRQHAQRQAEIEAQVDRELEEFYSEFDWAQGQQTELQNLLNARPNLSLREAALMLEAYAYKHGFDLASPLAEQIEAARTKHATQQQQPPQRPNAARSASPNATGDVPITQRRAGTATGHDRSNRDIVRETLREHGFNTDNI